MQKEKNWMTTRELLEATGIKYSQFNYLINNYIIPKSMVNHYGSGVTRVFAPEAVDIVVKWLEKNKR
jgi:hypothetical protein